LDVATAELMHNYTTSTCFSLFDPEMQTFMQTTVPQMGFEHKHILHLILAVSALHLAHFKRARRGYYLDLADRHYQAGLRIATSLLSNLDEENCHSIYLFTTMTTTYSLAKGPKAGDFMLFRDDGPAEWLSLFRGSKPMFEVYGDAIMNGVLAPMMQPGLTQSNRGPGDLPSLETDKLTRLRILIQETETSPDDLQVLNAAAENLLVLFSSRYDNGRKIQISMRNIGIWLYKSTDEFTVLLQQRHPAALVVFAYVCVVMNDLGSSWVMKGWVSHLVEGIYGRLDVQFRPWIQWPLQQIGWIPP
jgi:Fungal specific transcription factor domain